MTPGADEHDVVHGDLFTPYGIAFGDGGMYVTTGAVVPDGGMVMRYPLP